MEEITPKMVLLRKKQIRKKILRKRYNVKFFEFWKVVFNKNEKTLLSDKRARKIQARLVDGYQVEDIKLAIAKLF